MILPKAKNKYLDREVDNFNWIWRLRDALLNKEIEALDLEPGSLWRHQKQCILVGAYRPHFAFWLDMGTGKTLIALKICEVHDVERVLVLVPYLVQIETWKAEIEKWKPPFEVDVMTYAAARNRSCTKVESKRKRGGNRLWVDPRKALTFGREYGATIVDESSLIGNRNSVIFRAIKQISVRHQVRLALSGTPFGRDPSLLWSQMRFVDKGESLGQWGMFRECFLREGRYSSFLLRKRELPKLQRLMGHRSVRIKIEDCLTMPDKVYNKIVYDMPKQAQSAYKEMMSTMLKVIKDGEPLEVESCFVRLRQISSGFLYLKDEEGREVMDLGLKTRIEAVSEIIESTNEPVIVFHEFHATRDRALEVFQKRKVEVETDPEAWVGGRGQVLLLPNAAGALGGNFQRARYTFFLETPLSPLTRSQAEARTWRGGQQKTCVYYDAVAKGGLDWKILATLKEGKNLMKEVLEGNTTIVDI